MSRFYVRPPILTAHFFVSRSSARITWSWWKENCLSIFSRTHLASNEPSLSCQLGWMHKLFHWNEGCRWLLLWNERWFWFFRILLSKSEFVHWNTYLYILESLDNYQNHLKDSISSSFPGLPVVEFTVKWNSSHIQTSLELLASCNFAVEYGGPQLSRQNKVTALQT